MVVYEPFKTRPLTDFYDELRFELKNLPSQLFDYYLVRTAITMAKKGNLIRRRAIINASHCVTRYRLLSPDGMKISGVLSIRNTPYCTCSNREIPRTFTAPEGSLACRRDHAWYDDQESVLHVAPCACHGTYYVTLAVTPTMGACELPSEFYDDFLPTLMMGTKGSIMLLTGRPWSNLQVGQAYYNEFEELIREDALDTATHKMRGGIKMQFGRVM